MCPNVAGPLTSWCRLLQELASALPSRVASLEPHALADLLRALVDGAAELPAVASAVKAAEKPLEEALGKLLAQQQQQPAATAAAAGAAAAAAEQPQPQLLPARSLVAVVLACGELKLKLPQAALAAAGNRCAGLLLEPKAGGVASVAGRDTLGGEDIADLLYAFRLVRVGRQVLLSHAALVLPPPPAHPLPSSPQCSTEGRGPSTNPSCPLLHTVLLLPSSLPPG